MLSKFCTDIKTGNQNFFAKLSLEVLNLKLLKLEVTKKFSLETVNERFYTGQCQPQHFGTSFEHVMQHGFGIQLLFWVMVSDQLL